MVIDGVNFSLPDTVQTDPVAICQANVDKVMDFCLNNPYAVTGGYFFQAVGAYILFELVCWTLQDLQEKRMMFDPDQYRKARRLMWIGRIVCIINIGIGKVLL